ncbi:MAG: glycosyl hydrolase family 98 C-terminal domain-containing protein [Acutalibacteraceae bacterium]|nr:glycosyl hydrolase family 98 C-terminal domain-containing protein [Acutalibacteraceae bacterium]
MKKIISVILIFAILLVFPIQVSAEDTSFDTGFVDLPEKSNAPGKIRTRKQVDGLRMYVDEENPIFMIRNCPVWGGPQTGEAFAEYAIKTYYALPEDVRNFAVIYIDEGTTDMTPQRQLEFWDELLTVTDEANVPIVCQSECFCTNKTRDPFTQEELSAVFKEHPSLMGFVQVELSTNGVTNEKLAYDEVTDDNGVNKNILARLKSCIKACAENGGLFIWQDMEYIYWKKSNYINYILKDKELYNLLKSNTENIIIMDKHNGHGRHFASQSNILGCWLDDVCGNWGVNLENFLWYEEGFIDYDDLGVAPNEPNPVTTAKYPPALYGIDMIADLVGGATVYAIEGTFSRGGLYHFIDGEVVMTPTFYGVLYPIYRLILNGAVPIKDEVKENIKVAYKMTIPTSYALSGNDAHLLQGLYCDTFSFFQEKFENIYHDCTKTWVPSTGRYYIVPILPIHSDPKEVLPESKILNDFTYFLNLLFINPIKTKYFNKHYEENYTGDGVLFDINDYIYIFNSNENKTINSEQTVNYTLPESQLEIKAEFVAHTYAIINENEEKIEIDLCNLRLDTDAVCNGLESEDQFMREYAAGGKMSNPEDFRTSVITLSGFDAPPSVNATGSNGTKGRAEWDAETKTLTLTIISNGETRITIEQ